MKTSMCLTVGFVVVELSACGITEPQRMRPASRILSEARE